MAAAPCCPQPPKPRRNLGLEFLTSSLGVATATTITQPIDLVKTRMQLELLRGEQGASTAASRPSSSSSGLFATASGVVRREGVLALWGGAAPAAIRGMSYGGLRLGLYGPIRDALAAASSSSASASGASSSSSSPQNASFGIKLASGAASGALAAAITSPTELVKVRMQALPATAVVVAAAAAAKPTATTTTATTSRPPQPPAPPRPPVHHTHTPMPAGLAGMSCSASSSSSSSGLRAVSSSTAPTPTPPSSLSRLTLIVRQVVAEDGVRGLWRGATPGMIRAAVLTASQCATYDSAKRHLAALTALPDESLALQTGCALLTGLASTTATQPVDVIKTHMFVTKRNGGGGVHNNNTNSGGGGVFATAKHIWQSHGARGFLRGWTANYARLGPMTVLIFTTTELLRKQLGMGAL